MHVGIVADDLTGAADSAAPFAQRGFGAHVSFGLTDDAIDRFRGSDVLALITDTRDTLELPDTARMSVVRRAVRALVRLAPDLYFKKMDSTLRGYLRLELDAFRSELLGRIALVCPAFPANGRTIRQGALSIHGRPWRETPFALAYPATRIPGTVRAAFNYHDDPFAAELPLETIRAGLDAVEATVRQCAQREIHTLFCDAETEADLDTLAQLILRLPNVTLPVGSGGLAAALAARIEPAGLGSTSWSLEPFVHGRVLVVVGTLNPVSRSQAQFLMEKTGIRPMLYYKQEAENPPRDSPLVLEKKIGALFAPGQRIGLLMTEEVPQQQAIRTLLERAGVAFSLTGEDRLEGLIVTGGETALQLCRSIAATGIKLMGETQPGVVCATLISAGKDNQMFHNLPVILKSGGFGTRDMLVRCLGLCPETE